MPCSGTSISSPSITCLDFQLAWDISGATPKVTITNASTVANAANLKWWFYVASPSAIDIYGQDLDSLSSLPTPDVNGTAWTTKEITLPTPFGNPPCGQIEFSPNSGYVVKVFVQDTAGTPPPTYFSLEKDTIIVRPKGNKNTSCGNFGTAAVGMKVDCLGKLIMLFDNTNLAYNSILLPSDTSNKWTVVYPEVAGEIPKRTAENVPNVNFPTGGDSKGYVLYFQEYATYDYGNGVTVTVQYKLFSSDGSYGMPFAINCNTNLCQLSCQMQKFYKLAKGSCTTLVNPELMGKMTQMNFIYNTKILTGIFQPLCGIDVPAAIEEVKAIGNFDDSCDCGCPDSGGFSNPTGAGSTGACCPVTVDVINIATDNPPAACPNSYFPAKVYEPDGTTLIGTAYNVNDLVSLVNGNGEWQVYGVAFAQGNCKIGWFPANAATIPPDVPVELISGTIGGVPYSDEIVMLGTTSPATGCPGTGLYPCRVYNPAGDTLIGVANTPAELVSILNGYSAWAAYGTAVVQDNCNVLWYLADATNIPPFIQVDATTNSTTCVNGAALYTVQMVDECNPLLPITSTDFPLNVWVDFGLGAGPVYLGVLSNISSVITALNSTSTKPSSVSFAASGGTDISQIVVTNSSCATYSGTVTVTADKGSGSFLLVGASHSRMNTTPATVGGVYGAGLRTMVSLGHIPSSPAIDSDDVPWHNTMIGNTYITACGNTGVVSLWNMSNPLMPTLIRTIALTNPTGNSFTGTPTMKDYTGATGVPSYFTLYFPTDYHNMSLSAIYVCEAVTGTLWKLDATSTGSGVTTAFQSNSLIGKCPRCIIGNKLYFTQDGSLEVDTGQTSGVAIGDIVIQDLSSFSGAGLSTATIFLNQIEYVYSCSFDGSDTIWFVSNLGSVAEYSVSGATVVNRYLLALGRTVRYRSWTKVFAGNLYITTLQGYDPVGLNFGTLYVDIASLATTPVVTFFDSIPSSITNTAPSVRVYSVLPLGNCLMIVSGDAGTYAPGGGGLILYKTDGTYLGMIQLPNSVNILNVIAIPNVAVYTPTTFS